jgi:hypothetical protein
MEPTLKIIYAVVYYIISITSDLSLVIPIYLVLQLVRSNRHRFMPPQADEEIHQLSYLQKHMENIITLLADSVEGDGNDSLVCHLFS